MPWGRLDDGVNDNPKFTNISDSAFRLWVCGLVYCQKHLTDGFIPEDEVQYLKVRAKARPPLVAELLASQPTIGKGPLWHRVDGGYRMHDYFDWNDDAATIRAKRKVASDRLKRHRNTVLKRVSQRVSNTVSQRVSCGERTLFETPSVRASTYHVPHVLQEQERAGAHSYPVEAVENRTVLLLRQLRSRETSSGKPDERVLAALVRAVITDHPTVMDDGELKDLVKDACARVNLLYDSGSVARAIDTARAQLRRMAVPA